MNLRPPATPPPKKKRANSPKSCGPTVQRSSASKPITPLHLSITPETLCSGCGIPFLRVQPGHVLCGQCYHHNQAVAYIAAARWHQRMSAQAAGSS